METESSELHKKKLGFLHDNQQLIFIACFCFKKYLP